MKRRLRFGDDWDVTREPVRKRRRRKSLKGSETAPLPFDGLETELEPAPDPVVRATAEARAAANPDEVTLAKKKASRKKTAPKVAKKAARKVAYVAHIRPLASVHTHMCLK